MAAGTSRRTRLGHRMEHETDPDTGEIIHLDIDPVIPTGICAACAAGPAQEGTA